MVAVVPLNEVIDALALKDLTCRLSPRLIIVVLVHCCLLLETSNILIAVEVLPLYEIYEELY